MLVTFKLQLTDSVIEILLEVINHHRMQCESFSR